MLPMVLTDATCAMAISRRCLRRFSGNSNILVDAEVVETAVAAVVAAVATAAGVDERTSIVLIAIALSSRALTAKHCVLSCILLL